MRTPEAEVSELMPPEDVVKLLPPDDGDNYTSLYRMYGSAGQLLYIGVTPQVITRMGQHRRTSRWFRDVARIEIQHFDTRGEAMAAETQAIRIENPRYNLQDAGRRIAWDGARLKRARELAGLTQTEAARGAHLSPTTIAKYEQNKAQPSIPALTSLARLLNVSSDALLGLTEDEKLDQPGEPAELPPAKSLAWGMRYARVQRGLMTQNQLAKETGIPASRIRWFENGSRLPDDADLTNIAEVLGVDTGWLMAGEQDADQ